jgi:hypothetical protein
MILGTFREDKMTDPEYQQWWQLHMRIAHNEILNAEEQALYRAGINELDQEESAQLQLAPSTNLLQLRNQIQLLTQSLTQLMARSEHLNRRIADLEQTYQQLTGYPLLMDAHAARQV